MLRQVRKWRLYMRHLLEVGPSSSRSDRSGDPHLPPRKVKKWKQGGGQEVSATVAATVASGADFWEANAEGAEQEGLFW